jgi:hypothetical protein
MYLTQRIRGSHPIIVSELTKKMGTLAAAELVNVQVEPAVLALEHPISIPLRHKDLIHL